MSKRAPEYTPMCNKHLRFYFSDPKREEFRSILARKQFEAAKKAVASLSPKEQQWLQSIIPGAQSRDLLDSYIKNNLIASGAGKQDIERFYDLLRRVNIKIAIALGYAEDNKATIQWTTNF